MTFVTELCPGDILQNKIFGILKVYGAAIYTVKTYKVNTIRYCSYTYHVKPFKSIVRSDDNILYMWSMLHPHAKSHKARVICILKLT